MIECGYSKTARTIGDLTGFKLSKRKKRNEPLPPILPPAGRWHYIVLTRVLTSLSLQKTKSVIALTDRFPSLTGKAPCVEIMTSTFSSDWMKALQNPNHSDVTFILEGSHKLDAHRLVLCAASKFFQKVFRFFQNEQVGKSSLLHFCVNSIKINFNTGTAFSINKSTFEKKFKLFY